MIYGLIALFQTIPALALTIQVQPESGMVYSAAEAVTHCREAGHPAKGCSDAVKNQKVEATALETCLTFKDEASTQEKMDDDRPQSEKGPGFARYGKCLEAVRGKSFHVKALDVCAVMNDVIQMYQCLGTIADKPFQDAATDLCVKTSYTDPAVGIECLKTVEGRFYTNAQLGRCKTQKGAAQLTCLSGTHQKALADCQRTLADVEQKIQGLSQSSSDRAIKQSVAPVLRALREREDGVGEDAKDAR